MLREGGASSTPWPIGQSPASLEYWIVRLRGRWQRGWCHRTPLWTATTSKYDSAISPHVSREVWPARFALSYQRAQGMPGVRCAR